MPDLSDLDRFDRGLPPMNPLPPSEVRRRGDRLRRRNTALAAGAGVLVAALAIGTPFVALGGDGRELQPAPGPSPTVPADGWITTIPDGFPIGDGMGIAGDPPHVGEERGEVVFTSIGVCGRSPWTLDGKPDPTTDALGAVWSDGIEGGEQRTLATYSDDQSAQRALLTVGSAVAECGPQEAFGDQVVIEPRRLDSATGEESLAYVDRYRDAAGYTGEGNVFVLTRVGNALLIDKTYIGGAGDLAIAQDTVSLLTDRSAGVVAAMCVFAAKPCTDPTAQ